MDPGPSRATTHRVAPRAALAVPIVAATTLLTALVVASAAGVPLRDPDQVASGRLLVALSLAVAFVVVDIAWRAAGRADGRLPTLEALLAVRRERWTGRRLLIVLVAVVSFSLTYYAYRNLKSVVPLLRPDALFDIDLQRMDLDLLGGRDPAELLHSLLGTGLAAHALSAVYLLLFAFIPLSLGAALVFSPQLDRGLFYATALAVNWLLAAGSYFLLPSIGPFFVAPGAFSDLPATAVSHLQATLLQERASFLADPSLPGSAQSIGAFASLHVSVYVTAGIAAHLLHLGRPIKGVVWVLAALTMIATVYFGWHYLLDDIGGVVIAVVSLETARRLTGVDAPWRAAFPLRARAAGPEVAA